MKILKKIYDTSLVNKIFALTYVALKDSYDKRRYEKYRKIYDIDPTFNFSGTEIILFGKGKIELGKNSYIVRYSILESGENCKIVIGQNCAIGPYVKMYTMGRLTDQNLNQNPLSGDIKFSKGNIIIEDGCWIGANVSIKGGVKIGENSIIGMNSVVTKNVPSHCVAGGCPAKILKYKSKV
jgi:maltose O-acetyltransferase